MPSRPCSPKYGSGGPYMVRKCTEAAESDLNLCIFPPTAKEPQQKRPARNLLAGLVFGILGGKSPFLRCLRRGHGRAATDP